MPYLVSSIIAVVSAMIILLTRYEADDSSITGEIDRVKSMFVMVDGFVNTYIQSGGDLTEVNFQVLYDNGILPGNIDKDDIHVYVEGENPKLEDMIKTKLIFPESKVIWQIIPIPSDDAKFASSAGSGYKLLVDMSDNSSLMSKAIFSESFSSREYCEKLLFASKDIKGIGPVDEKSNFPSTGEDDDGKFVCTVFK